MLFHWDRAEKQLGLVDKSIGAAIHLVDHLMLCCAVLCCAVLCCAVLCCVVVHSGWGGDDPEREPEHRLLCSCLCTAPACVFKWVQTTLFMNGDPILCSAARLLMYLMRLLLPLSPRCRRYAG